MNSTAMSVVGDTVCDVLYRYYQDDSDELERNVYALNPNLNAMPVILPTGTRITLPRQDAVTEVTATPQRVVTVWD